MVAPTPTHPQAAPGPPSRFRGGFRWDTDALHAAARASGPFLGAPSAVAFPRDAEDVAALVGWAAGEGISLVPRGAGTGMPGGNVGPGIAVDLTGLRGVEPVDPDEGTFRVGAGATGADLATAAAARGRFFPALPSSADRCTVGGMVANNAAGARSMGYGAVHRWVEGVEVILADGTRETFRRGEPAARFRALADTLRGEGPLPWPSVRKNSSGYALDRFLATADPLDLIVGSEGTLGVVTQTWLRTAPEPRERALALVPLPEPTALDTAVAAVAAVGAPVCEFFSARFLDVAGLRTKPDLAPLLGSHPALLLVEVDGDDVTAQLHDLKALAGDLGVGIALGRSPEEQQRLWAVRHAASPVVAAQAEHGLVSMQFIEDSVVPPGSLSTYLAGLDAILAEEETDAVVFGHAGDANVHVNPLVDVRRADWRERVGRILEKTVDLVASLGGTLAGEHGDGRLRAPFHPRIFGSATSRRFAEVKRALDPLGILNPGTVVALPGQDPLAGLAPHRRAG